MTEGQPTAREHPTVIFTITINYPLEKMQRVTLGDRLTSTSNFEDVFYESVVSAGVSVPFGLVLSAILFGGPFHMRTVMSFVNLCKSACLHSFSLDQRFQSSVSYLFN